MNGRFNETWKPCGMKGSRIATATCQWASWQDSLLHDRTRAAGSRSRRGHTEEDVRICTLHDRRDVLLIRPSRVLTMRLRGSAISSYSSEKWCRNKRVFCTWRRRSQESYYALLRELYRPRRFWNSSLKARHFGLPTFTLHTKEIWTTVFENINPVLL